ncbi:NGCA protein, partial [Grantiella picta]|nr:NGCA protein [Grantiella picta]
PGTPAPPPQPGVLTVLGDARGALLGGLHPWSHYRLHVVVFNGRGEGPPSAEITFDTPEGGETPATPE